MSIFSRFCQYGIILLLAVLAGFLLGRRAGRYSATRSGENNLSAIGLADAKNLSHSTLSPLSSTGEAVAFVPNDQQLKREIDHLINNLSSESRFDQLAQKLSEWASREPDAALSFARTNFLHERRTMLLTRMLTDLAQTNPQAAWSWTLQNEAQNFQYVDTVLSETAKVDAKQGWAFAEQFAGKHPDEAYNAYYGALRGIVYSGDYETATRLVRETDLISPTNGVCDFPGLISSQWARYEPEQAAAWVLSLSDGTSRSQALAQVGGAWAQSDPEAAADFAVKLPAGKDRQWVLTQAIQNWADHDPVSVAKWINNQESSPDFDQIIMIVAATPNTDPQTALSWANSISQKELQIQAVTQIVSIWLGKDAVTANKYLQTSFSAEMQESLLERIKSLH